MRHTACLWHLVYFAAYAEVLICRCHLVTSAERRASGGDILERRSSGSLIYTAPHCRSNMAELDTNLLLELGWEEGASGAFHVPKGNGECSFNVLLRVCLLIQAQSVHASPVSPLLIMRLGHDPQTRSHGPRQTPASRPPE